jgi:hypothetical protein
MFASGMTSDRQNVAQTAPDGTGTGVCSTLYPLHSAPRLAAGMPIPHDIGLGVRF